MIQLTRRTGDRTSSLAPAIAGLALLVGALVLRLAFDADESHTRLFGRDFGTACWFRATYRLPCPNCGVTRSLILAAHGDLARAARLSWGGIALFVAMLFSGSALVALGVGRMRPSTIWQPRIERWAPRAIVDCADVTLALWVMGWLIAFARAWLSR